MGPRVESPEVAGERRQVGGGRQRHRKAGVKAPQPRMAPLDQPVHGQGDLRHGEHHVGLQATVKARETRDDHRGLRPAQGDRQGVVRQGDAGEEEGHGQDIRAEVDPQSSHRQ